MAKYKVKKITDGPLKGRWGLYRGSVLVMDHANKAGAVHDMNARNDRE